MKKPGCRIGPILVVLLGGLLLGCNVPPDLPPGERVVYEHDSIYHHILISQDREARYIRFGYGEIQGAMTLADPTALRVPYTDYLAIGMAFTHPKRALMVGLASGAMVRFLRAYRPNLMLDVVEIDPEVVAVTRRYFDAGESPTCRIHVEDGRVFVRRTRERYDWVILDAFRADTVPYHLTTIEFLREVRSILRPGGVVTANIAPWGPGVLYLSMIRTFTEVFPQVYLFQVPHRGNIVLVATLDGRRVPSAEIAAAIRRVKDSAKDALALLKPTGPFLDGKPMVLGVPTLTDDYAPVDLLRYLKMKPPMAWLNNR